MAETLILAINLATVVLILISTLIWGFVVGLVFVMLFTSK